MKRTDGFTLVEVLVALAITAIALGAGLNAAGALTDNAQRLGDALAHQRNVRRHARRLGHDGGVDVANLKPGLRHPNAHLPQQVQ